MRLKTEVKVGLIVVSGIALLLGTYWFLGGLGLRTSTYPIFAIFDNAQRLDKGSVVRLAGVKIGVVSDTRLCCGHRAGVDMLIWKGNKLPKDSTARVTQGGFIGETYVEIEAGKSSQMLQPGNRIRTATTIQPEEIMQNAADLLKQLQASTKGINELIGDRKLIASVRDTVKSMDEAARSASRLTQAAEAMVARSSPGVERTLANVEVAAANANRISEELEGILRSDVRPQLSTIFSKVDELLRDIDSVVTDVQTISKSLRSGSEGVGDLMTDADKAMESVAAASEEARQMMVNLKDATGGIKDVMTDKELQTNLKALVCNAAAAAEQINELSASLNKRFGSKRPQPTKADIDAIPDRGVAVNALANIDRGQYRLDAYYTGLVPNSLDTFYRLGAYDIGENTGVILQGGSVFGNANAFRYGLYDSRIGLGYDRRFSSRGLLSFDLFRPNDPNLEIRGTYGIGNNFGLYAGVQDIIDTSRRDVLVGVQYRK